MRIYLFLTLFCLFSIQTKTSGFILINQLGYLPQSFKVAVFISDEKVEITSFQLFETLSGKLVFEGQTEAADAQMWGKQSAYRLNFSAFQQKGGYFLKAGNSVSPSFRISHDVYYGIG